MEKDLVSLIVGTLNDLSEQEEVAVRVAIDENAPLFARNGLELVGEGMYGERFKKMRSA